MPERAAVQVTRQDITSIVEIEGISAAECTEACLYPVDCSRYDFFHTVQHLISLTSMIFRCFYRRLVGKIGCQCHEIVREEG